MSKFSPATYLDISSPAPTSNNLKTSIEHPQVFRLTENTRLANTKGWKTESYTLDQLVQNLTSHEYVTKKDDARAFAPGVVIDERRVKSAISELSLVVLDLDKGEDIEAVSALIKSRGLHAIIYSSHSHGSAETAIKLDDYRKFSRQREVSVQWLRSYLLEKCRFQPWVVEQITCVDEARETPTGFVCVVGHSPLPKYRVVLPLREPFRRREVVKNGGSQADFERQWKEKYSAVASSLAVAWDAACCDVSRAFYFPACKPDTEPFAEVITGDLLDLDDFAVAVPSLSSTTKSPAQRTNPKSSTAGHHGHHLTTWIAQFGSTFEIEAALRHRASSEIFRSLRPGSPGVHIRCPFEDTHTKAGGDGTFVVNASENEGRGFGIHCCHEHCLSDRGDGKKVDRLSFIQKLLDDGWLTIEDLSNPELGGGTISARFHHQRRQPSSGRDLRVVDREGKGIDVGVFHPSIVAAGRLDLARLNQLCKTQIAQDLTPEQMADFIESGQITVAHLITCIRRDDEATQNDPYLARLTEIARQKVSGSTTAHQIERSLAAVRAEFNVKQKTIEADFKAVEQKLQSVDAHSDLGVLSADDTKLIKPLRDYAERFAIINTGGKAMVMNLDEPDLSKALMARSDFEFLHQGDWIDGGTGHTIYPAKEFVKKPPRNTRVYHGGFVFRPSGTVQADQFNLYKGMLVEPDASGSCSLLHELIEQVWAGENPDVAEWVLEWLMHIVAHPGEKVGTSIAIRGEPGDGKSIVFERLIGTILGDMLLRITNHKMILGDFNEALIGKLITVLEEAAFSGDKQAFDQMKELITGDKVLINPKFKAPITVENYSRLVVISNHDHFLHIKSGDRRYTVLESSPAWQGTQKFEQLVEQWKNGGAARFMYDALNHSFRRMDGRNRLVINTVLKTPATVRQMALSRSGLERFVVEFVLNGSLSDREGFPLVSGAGGVRAIPNWELDESMDIRSQDLEQLARTWLHSFDRVSARHEATLHTIIGTLHRYIGETEEIRPKGRDEETGTRVQLPTVRRLPPRRAAIEHAWKNGLITDDEYRALNTADTRMNISTKMPDELEIEKYEEELGKLREIIRKLSPLSISEQIERRRQMVLPLFGQEVGVRGPALNIMPI